MCNADASEKVEVVCSTRILTRCILSLTSILEILSWIEVMTYSKIMDDSCVKYLEGSIMKLSFKTDLSGRTDI